MVLAFDMASLSAEERSAFGSITPVAAMLKKYRRHGIFLYASSIGRLYRNGNCRPSWTGAWLCRRNDCI